MNYDLQSTPIHFIALDSKLDLPSVPVIRPSAMRVPSQTAGTSLLKPDSTPLQNKIKLSASLRAGSSII